MTRCSVHCQLNNPLGRFRSLQAPVSAPERGHTPRGPSPPHPGSRAPLGPRPAGSCNRCQLLAPWRARCSSSWPWRCAPRCPLHAPPHRPASRRLPCGEPQEQPGSAAEQSTSAQRRCGVCSCKRARRRCAAGPAARGAETVRQLRAGAAVCAAEPLLHPKRPCSRQAAAPTQVKQPPPHSHCHTHKHDPTRQLLGRRGHQRRAPRAAAAVGSSHARGWPRGASTQTRGAAHRGARAGAVFKRRQRRPPRAAER